MFIPLVLTLNNFVMKIIHTHEKIRKLLDKYQPRKIYMRLKSKSPKVAHETCPAIDKVLDALEKLSTSGKPITEAKFKSLQKQMEKLRTANESLRDSGRYWYNACKEILDPNY
jgi:lysyl-tRNA synthetase class I